MEEELREKQESEVAGEEHGSKERDAALPEGRAGGRRGETARIPRRSGVRGEDHAGERTMTERCQLFLCDGLGLVLPDFRAG